MRTEAFERLAGLCAIGAGIAGFLYSLSFIVIARAAPQVGELLTAVFLLAGGVLATVVLTALYEHLRRADEGFARWALILSVAAALGSAIHGGYNLANAINPPVSSSAALDLPSQIDPRGLLTFGVAGISLFVLSWLMRRTGDWPRALGALGYLLGALFLILYLGRLIVVDATSPVILVPALLAGFVLNPVWYVWIGLTLWRRPIQAETRRPVARLQGV